MVARRVRQAHLNPARRSRSNPRVIKRKASTGRQTAPPDRLATTNTRPADTDPKR